jgi:hypothetical protein
MRHVNLIWNLEGSRRPKLLPPVLPLVLVLQAVTVVVVVGVARRGWVIDALRIARVSGQHGDLTEVGDLDNYGVVLLGKRLLPWLPVNPHERVFGRSFVELEPEPVGLKEKGSTSNHKIQLNAPDADRVNISTHLS